MYTGLVTVGGSADVHELAGLIINKIAVGPYDNNSYLLRCRRTGKQVLIDAAAEPETLVSLIGDDGLATVITTHSHADHWQALAAVVATTNAQTIAHPLDAIDIPVPTDITVVDGDVITFGDCSLAVTHLIGHTPGSIALIYNDPEGPPHVFTGDCLFPGGVGKTSSPELFNSLLTGVTQKLFDVLPDETWVYPGHGKDTTLGDERSSLAQWRARQW